MSEENKQLWAIIESLFAQLQEERKENEILRTILHVSLPELGYDDKN